MRGDGLSRYPGAAVTRSLGGFYPAYHVPGTPCRSRHTLPYLTAVHQLLGSYHPALHQVRKQLRVQSLLPGLVNCGPEQNTSFWAYKPVIPRARVPVANEPRPR